MKRELPTKSFAPALQVAPTAGVLLGALSLSWREQGSIARGDWLLFAVLVPLLLATIVLFSDVKIAGPPLLAAVALGGLALWTALSIAWSPLPAAARDEALLLTLYASALAIPALTLKENRERLIVIGLVAAYSGLLALGAALQLVRSASPDEFVGARLTFPVSYVNANGAAFLLGFWSAVALAAGRSLPVGVRTLAAGAAGATLAAWVVTQSKGGGIALAASAVVVLAVSPLRLRLLLAAAMPAVVVAFAYRPLTTPFRNQGEDQLADAGHTAGRAILAVLAATVVLGLVYAVLDRSIAMSPNARDLVGRATAVGLAAALLGVVALTAVRVDDPRGYVSDKWTAFKSPLGVETGSSHFANLGSNRYDFWRVELRGFGHHPLAGIGGGGFGPEYRRERASVETPARGHSIVFDALLETGIVGLALLAAGLGAACFGLVRLSGSLAGAAALGGFTYFVVHASGDWIWTFPALGLPAFALAGAALSAGDGIRLPRAATVAAGAAAALAALAAVPALLADRIVDDALAHGDPSALSTARRLDPWAIEPWLAELSFATTPAARIAALRGALEQDGSALSLRILLGQTLLAEGRRQEGIAELEEAVRRDPRNRDARAALARARRSAPIG